jgi:hypothetical protein
MDFITDVLLVLCVFFLAYSAVSTSMWHLWENKCKDLEKTNNILRSRIKEQAEELNDYRHREIIRTANAYYNSEVKDNGNEGM